MTELMTPIEDPLAEHEARQRALRAEAEEISALRDEVESTRLSTEDEAAIDEFLARKARMAELAAETRARTPMLICLGGPLNHPCGHVFRDGHRDICPRCNTDHRR